MKGDEKYPLLYLIVDRDDNGSNNRRFFERRRGITAGVSNVFEQWPGYLSSCWITFLLFMLAIVTLYILLVTTLSTYRLQRIPRCIGGDNPLLDNSTIHLVHGPDLWTQHQLDMIERIIQVFPNHRIHLIMIKKIRYDDLFNKKEFDTKNVENSNKISTTNAVGTRKLLGLLEDPLEKTNNIFGKEDVANEFSNDSLFGWPFFDPKDFINNFLRKSIKHPLRRRLTTVKPLKVSNIAALLLKYPSIYVEMLTFEEVFERTPLFFTWHYLNDETKIFSVRVLQLWQYGGLSFDLLQTKNAVDNHMPTTDNVVVTTEKYQSTVINSTEATEKIHEKGNDQHSSYVESLLYLGYSNFQMIPGGIVTLAENGCHMETKSACHSFFGEILMNLKEGTRYTTPEDVIKGALKFFLKSGHRRRN